MDLIEYLNNSPMVFVICSGILGLAVGSFLNVVILRLPVMMERQWLAQCHELLHDNEDVVRQPSENDTDQQRFDLIYPPSHCPQCGQDIGAGKYPGPELFDTERQMLGMRYTYTGALPPD